MEQQRNLLFMLLIAAGLFLFFDWNQDKANEARMAEQATEITNQTEADVSLKDTVSLISDNLDLTISLQGGDIVDAKLLKVKKELDKDDPFELLMTEPKFIYQAQSGLAGTDGIDNASRPLYAASQKEFRLAENENSVSASLTLEKDGVTYIKTFTVERDSYVVNVSYDIRNSSSKDLNLVMYSQLKQTADNSAVQSSGGFGMVASAYRGTAYSTDETRYEKTSLDDIASGERTSVRTKNGWVAMIQHYFVSAWIGGDNENGNVIYKQSGKKDEIAIIGIRSENTKIGAGENKTLSAKLWVGPKNQDVMNEVADNLGLTVDYGWLWFISKPLFKLLTFIQGFVGNWGVAIIILTFIVRGVMFPLTKAQYTSMAKMRLLQPKIQEIRDRFKDDRQKVGAETMKLYKTEKVNPLGGCLPLLIQMPIFIALYWTLMESAELRQSGFILWIKDLSVYDPFFVLPLLYGVSMYIMQKMSPTAVTDPLQKKIFMAMPFVFTFMFCTFPAGLTLYWLVSNCFTILQQVIIYRSLEKKGLSMKTPAKSKK